MTPKTLPILLHSPGFDEVQTRLRRAILDAGANANLCARSAVFTFASDVLERADQNTLIIVRFEDHAHMETLRNLCIVLRRFRLVLVIPESQRASMPIYYEFHPRLVLFEDDDFGQISAVIRRLAHRLDTAEHAPLDNVHEPSNFARVTAGQYAREIG